MSDVEDREAKAAPEVVEAALEKMRSILRAPPREKKADAPIVAKVVPKVPMLSDVGHGSTCTCEICWQMRMREVFPDSYPLRQNARATAPGVSEAATLGAGGSSSAVAAPDAVVTPPQKESKLDMLRRLFPL